MATRSKLWICTLFLAAGCYTSAQSAPARGPSTPEERTRAVEIAHKLQSDPLDQSLNREREWAIKWLIEVPDIHVELCTNILGDFYKPKYKYSSEITVQLTLSSAASVIEHPDQASDRMAQFVAAVEGALKAYKAILQAKPGAKSKALEELVEKQNEGKLTESVRESAKKCK